MIRITDKKSCVGCWACRSVCPKQCISMEEDSEGFRYPKVEESNCINCGLCEKVCPMLQPQAERPVQAVYTCINKDEYVRSKSTSGGCFSLLAANVLAMGGVVAGAVFDENLEVRHIVINNAADLELLRCSKYVQSRMEDTMKLAKKALVEGKYVLFSGTPCQIAGFSHFLGKEYEKLFLVDVVCHGVPSPKVYRRYLLETEAKLGEHIEKVNFRDKSTGWKTSSFVLTGKNKSIQATKQQSPYMRGFLQGLFVRPSCAVCHFNNQHSSADLTIADYWGVETKFPELNDDKGITVVLINTAKGRELFAAANVNAKVLESDFTHASEHNFAMCKLSSPHAKREEFFSELGKEKIDSLVERLLHL